MEDDVTPPDLERRQPGQEARRIYNQKIERRSSKKSSSHDRRGRVFEDDYRDKNIRPVTPDSPSSPPVGTARKDVHYFPPSPRPSRPHHAHRAKDHSDSVSNTDEEPIMKGRRQKTKAKSTAKDEPKADSSPNSFITKTRQRLGSLTTTGPFARLDDESSIGFPSVVQSPPLSELAGHRQQLAGAPRRAQSPDLSNVSQSAMVGPPLVGARDSSKVLHLMKTTCGRMHGILFFRPSDVGPWASGYCAINVAPGSLVCQVKGEVSMTKTMIPDLRGCSVRTHYDAETQSTYLSIVAATTGLMYQLRPPVPETFDSWLAALLCWQPLRPKEMENKSSQSASISSIGRRLSQRRISEVPVRKSTATIKVGKMLLWDGLFPSAVPASRLNSKKRTSPEPLKQDPHSWRPINCMLQENGTLKLIADTDASPLASIQLSRLSRGAVQRTDPSTLNSDFCIAIYTPVVMKGHTHARPRPMFLAFESRVAFEVWYVLLRAFTVPELYAAETQLPAAEQSTETEATKIKEHAAAGMFRLERSMSVKITEVKLFLTSEGGDQRPKKQGQSNAAGTDDEMYAELMLDNETRARTTSKARSPSLLWAEEFVLGDIQAQRSLLRFVLKTSNPAEKEWTTVAHGHYDLPVTEDGPVAPMGELEVSSHDTIIGKVEIYLDELEHQAGVERWWPILTHNDQIVGEVLMRVQLQQAVVLLQQAYAGLSQLLHNFANTLTIQIAQILVPELKQLSDILLDIFQTTNSVTEWISALVEEEIDGIFNSTSSTRLRFGGRLHSNDSLESAEHRELHVRDLSRSAQTEANLLFRGNSLVSKALDAHMRRIGREYLEETLGPILKIIVTSDADCEVDPVRLKSADQLERNWNNLINFTTRVWEAIASSAARCPGQLRLLFRHIRSCADDRYGSFIRTVKYSSVSGFLFLRFFCPAILNPKLFGLVERTCAPHSPELSRCPGRTDHCVGFPAEKPRRTLTLIAKSLIALANMIKFGAKEPWMEPMNKFVVSATPKFKTYIDQVCSVGSTMSTTSHEPQYAAAAQILARLPPISREGVPSLPYLLDSAKAFARLVTLWIEHAPANISDMKVDECVLAFHTACHELHESARKSLGSAEQASRIDAGMLQERWQRHVGERPTRATTHEAFDDGIRLNDDNQNDITALPQIANGKRLSARFQRLSLSARPGSAGSVPNEEAEPTPPSSASFGWEVHPSRRPFGGHRPTRRRFRLMLWMKRGFGQNPAAGTAAPSRDTPS